MKRISTYFVFLMLVVLYMYQLTTLPMAHRLFYLSLISIFMVAFVYESYFLGCAIGKCTLEDNAKQIKLESFACEESSRVNWRRAFIITFIPYSIINQFYPSKFEMNTFYFIVSLFAAYFYFNFDQYHRTEIACKNSKTKN
jgi:hypothetical protein